MSGLAWDRRLRVVIDKYQRHPAHIGMLLFLPHHHPPPIFSTLIELDLFSLLNCQGRGDPPSTSPLPFLADHMSTLSHAR